MGKEAFGYKELAHLRYPASVPDVSKRGWNEVLPTIGKKFEELTGYQPFKHQIRGMRAVEVGDTLLNIGTGGGKTVAAILPALEQVAQARKRGERYGPILVVCPTRILLTELQERLSKLGRELLGEFEVARYSGEVPMDERKEIRESCKDLDGLLMTPHIYRGSLTRAEKKGEGDWRDTLLYPGWVFFDEIDFYNSHVISQLKVHYDLLKEKGRARNQAPRVILAGATIGNPEQFAQRFLGSGATVVGGAARHGPIEICVGELEAEEPRAVRGRPPRTVLDGFIEDYANGRVEAGLRPLIYFDNKFEIERYSYVNDLRALGFGYVYSDLPAEANARTYLAYKRGELEGLLATRILESGINIGTLAFMIMIGFPSGGRRGLHQTIGRVARKPKAEPGRILFLLSRANPLDKLLLTYRETLLTLLKELPLTPVRFYRKQQNPELFKLDLLLRALVDENREGRVEVGEEDTVLQRELTRLQAQGLLRQRGQKYAIHVERAAAYLFGMPLMRMVPHFQVVYERRDLGSMDLFKVAYGACPGNYILLGGELWEVVEVTRTQVRVKPAPPEFGRYSRNAVDRKVVFVEGHRRRTNGYWGRFGRLRIQLRPKVSALFNLETKQKVSRWEPFPPMRPLSYESEGFVVVPKVLLDGVQAHVLGYALAGVTGEVGVAAQDLTITSTRARAKVGVLMFDQGGTSGAAGMLWHKLEELAHLAHRHLKACACHAEGCPRCLALFERRPVAFGSSDVKQVVEVLKEMVDDG
ncbi:MAG: DEAD/DEAH box helicase [Candidatus Heimdallarchaeota archaeon]